MKRTTLPRHFPGNPHSQQRKLNRWVVSSLQQQPTSNKPDYKRDLLSWRSLFIIIFFCALHIFFISLNSTPRQTKIFPSFRSLIISTEPAVPGAVCKLVGRPRLLDLFSWCRIDWTIAPLAVGSVFAAVLSYRNETEWSEAKQNDWRHGKGHSLYNDCHHNNNGNNADHHQEEEPSSSPTRGTHHRRPSSRVKTWKIQRSNYHPDENSTASAGTTKTTIFQYGLKEVTASPVSPSPLPHKKQKKRNSKEPRVVSSPNHNHNDDTPEVLHTTQPQRQRKGSLVLYHHRHPPVAEVEQESSGMFHRRQSIGVVFWEDAEIKEEIASHAASQNKRGEWEHFWSSSMAYRNRRPERDFQRPFPVMEQELLVKCILQRSQAQEKWYVRNS